MTTPDLSIAAPEALERSLDELEARLLNKPVLDWVVESWRAFRGRASEINAQNPPFSFVTLASLVMGSAERFVNAFEASPTSFIDDLLALCDACGERSARMLKARFGLAGAPPAILEDIGRSEQVTRERARQLITRDVGRIVSAAPALATLQMTFDAARKCGQIITAQEWYATLPESHRPKDVGAMNAITAAMKLDLIPELTKSVIPNVWTLPGIDDEPLISLVTSVKAALSVDLSKWGAVQLSSIEALGNDGLRLATSFEPSLQTASLVNGWLVPQSQRDPLIARRVRRLATVVGVITFGRLIRQLGRCFPGSSLPPRSVCQRVLERDANVRFDEEDNADLTALERSGRLVPLSAGELAAVSVLRTLGGVATSEDFQKAFVATGYSAGMAGILGSRSIVLERYAVGVIGIAGQNFDREHLQALRKRARRSSASAMLGYTRVGTNIIEVRYKMDPDLLQSRMFSLPPGLIPVGQWTIREQKRKASVRTTYVTGLHRSALRVLKQGAALIRVRFDVTARCLDVCGDQLPSPTG